MQTARPTRFLLPLALAAVALLGGSSLASAQVAPAPDVTIDQEARCDDLDAQVELAIINGEDTALGVNVLLDGEVVEENLTIEAGETFYGVYFHPGAGASIVVQTTNDALTLAEADVLSETPDCAPIAGVDFETACEAGEPILNIGIVNLDEVDLGVNVYLDDESIATDLTVPTDAVPVITVPYPGEGAFVAVVTSTDELFLGGAELTDPEPECLTPPTTAPTGTDPATVTPPAAKPISGRASYTG